MSKQMVLPEKFKEPKCSRGFREHKPLHSGMIVVAFVNEPEEIDGQVVIKPDMKGIIECRIYWGKCDTAHCIVWIRDPDHWGIGIGAASGYGFHHESAALAVALQGMGITLGAFDCHSRGNSEMRATLEEIARQLGYTFVRTFEFGR